MCIYYAQVSRGWNYLCNSEALWKEKIHHQVEMGIAEMTYMHVTLCGMHVITCACRPTRIIHEEDTLMEEDISGGLEAQKELDQRQICGEADERTH